jgi:hypothetical protein
MVRKSRTTNDISNATDPDLHTALVLKRAALLARKIAIQTVTNLVIVRKGQITRISAKELQQSRTIEETDAS